MNSPGPGDIRHEQWQTLALRWAPQRSKPLWIYPDNQNDKQLAQQNMSQRSSLWVKDWACFVLNAVPYCASAGLCELSVWPPPPYPSRQRQVQKIKGMDELLVAFGNHTISLWFSRLLYLWQVGLGFGYDLLVTSRAAAQAYWEQFLQGGHNERGVCGVAVALSLCLSPFFIQHSPFLSAKAKCIHTN